MSAGGKSAHLLSEEFHARQRLDVLCDYCGRRVATNIHLEDAPALFAAHRKTAHPDLPPPRKQRRNTTAAGWEYRREHQDEKELAWRDGRRYVNTVGRA